MEIAAFDLIPTELLYERLLGWADTQDSINTNFEDEGFGSSLFLFNIGSILIILLIWVPALLLHIFLRCFVEFFCLGNQKKCGPDARQKVKNFVFWTHPILTLYESYFVISLCTLINMAYVVRNTPQETFSYILASIFLAICIGFPVVLMLYLCCSYDRLRLKRVKGAFGVIYRDLNLKRGRIVLIQPFWFMLRRFILAYICVKPPADALFFQFLTL